MKNRILLALFPVALLSMAAKGGCGGAEEPITSAPDAATPDAALVGDCPIPEPTCPSGTTFSVAGCTCVKTTCAPLPCPSDSTFSTATCTCVANASDASAADSAPPPPPADCPTPLPATSPFNVYIQGSPAGSTPSECTVSAKGSSGDTVTLTYANTLSDGTLSFVGTGGSTETYQLTVDYPHAIAVTATVNWSVAGCGFLENIDFATGTHNP